MDDTTRDFLEAGAAWVASKATFSGALTAVVGAVTSSKFIGFAGICIALLGLLVNWYFRARSDRRDQCEHEARMKRLERDSGAVPLARHTEQEEI